MMDCADVRALLDRWERGADLEMGELDRLLEHGRTCPACASSLGALAPLLERDARAASAARAPAAEAGALAASVLARIEPLPSPVSSRSRRRILPLAAAALLALGLGFGLLFGMRDSGTVTVRFALDAPQAKSVAIAGDFNGWKTEGYELRRSPEGSWEVELKLAKDRYYAYGFLLDGATWIADPARAETVDDGFGGMNSLLRL